MSLFISGFLLSLSLCLDLGIVNVSIIRNGVEKGFYPAFMIGLGSCFGDLLYAFISLAGISFILNFLFVRYTLWIGGTIVLLYFAYNMAKHTIKNSLHATESKEIKSGRYFWNGIALALSSPTSILWFATVGGSIIASNHYQDKFALAFFFSGFFMAGLIWSMSISLISSHGGKLGKTFSQTVSIISAILFLYFAVDIFLKGYKEFV